MTMLKPKKKEDDAPQQPTRLRMPTESAIRDYEGIKALLEDAKEKRGCLIELPWANGPDSRFVLTVQWEKHMNEPVWTLYEETNSGSRTVWCQPFPPSDMSFMFDVLTMSTGATASLESAIPENLRPSEETLQKLEQEKLENENAANHKKLSRSDAPDRAALPQARPSSAPAPAPAPAPSPAPAQAPAPQQAMPPPMPPGMPPHGYPMPIAPPMPMPPPMPYPPGYAYPPMPQQFPPGYPAPPAPLQYPGSVTPPHGYPLPPQPQGQGGWGMPAQQTHTGMPAQQTHTGMPAINPSIDPISDPGLPNQMNNFLQKAPGILLGSLLTDAGLITEPTLEAALKIQELVRAGRLDPTRATELLKLFYSMGSAIEEYIDPADLKKPDAAKKPNAQPTAPASAEQRRAAGSNQPKELTSALDLLIKAGLITQNDIKTANAVRAKHGGDLRMILQAAGKADTKTLDAAVVCVDLERQGLMKMEQCVILLNYCSRSRVGFDEAIDELGWPNPRKQRR